MTKSIDIKPGNREEERALNDLFDALFPICRSITGPGLRESLEIIGRLVPLELESVPSGERVFDWMVPREWRINSARLVGPDGNTYADIGQCQGKRTPDTSASTSYEGDLSSQVNIAFQLIILHSILRHISDVQAFRISRRDSTRSISGLMPSSVEIASDSSSRDIA